MNRWG